LSEDLPTPAVSHSSRREKWDLGAWFAVERWRSPSRLPIAVGHVTRRNPTDALAATFVSQIHRPSSSFLRQLAWSPAPAYLGPFPGKALRRRKSALGAQRVRRPRRSQAARAACWSRADTWNLPGKSPPPGENVLSAPGPCGDRGVARRHAPALARPSCGRF